MVKDTLGKSEPCSVDNEEVFSIPKAEGLELYCLTQFSIILIKFVGRDSNFSGEKQSRYSTAAIDSAVTVA